MAGLVPAIHVLTLLSQIPGLTSFDRDDLYSLVMAGLVPAIHVLTLLLQVIPGLTSFARDDLRFAQVISDAWRRISNGAAYGS
jgi:hypothetical protein